jgi:hypothetical protein
MPRSIHAENLHAVGTSGKIKITPSVADYATTTFSFLNTSHLPLFKFSTGSSAGGELYGRVRAMMCFCVALDLCGIDT